MVKYDLSDEYINELVELQRLFLLGASRTSSGSGSFISTSSSTTYNYTAGEADLYAQLQAVLLDYQITAASWNNLVNGTSHYLTTTNSSNDYTATPTTGLLSYNAGLTFNVKFNASNTGTSTLNIDSLGAKTLKKVLPSGKSNLATGDIIANGIYGVVYDSTDLILTNPTAIYNSLFATQGDMVYASTPNTPVVLAKGTARQQLAMNSGATAPEWVSSLQSLMTAQGDILQASGANTPVRLAIGSTGQVPTVVGGLLAYATPTHTNSGIFSGTVTASMPQNTDATQTIALGGSFTHGTVAIQGSSTSYGFIVHFTTTINDAISIGTSSDAGARIGSSSQLSGLFYNGGNEAVILKSARINGTNLELVWRNTYASSYAAAVTLGQWKVYK